MSRLIPLCAALALVAACSDSVTTPTDGGASLAKSQVMATGSGRFDNPFPDFNARGPVTCLAVSGNRAAIGFKVHVGDVDGVDIAGQGLILIVKDNGDGNSHALMAMSTQRKTLDFQKEFEELKQKLPQSAALHSSVGW